MSCWETRIPASCSSESQWEPMTPRIPRVAFATHPLAHLAIPSVEIESQAIFLFFFQQETQLKFGFALVARKFLIDMPQLEGS